MHKISPPPGFHPQTIQPLTSCHSDYANPAPTWYLTQGIHLLLSVDSSITTRCFTQHNYGELWQHLLHGSSCHCIWTIAYFEHEILKNVNCVMKVLFMLTVHQPQQLTYLRNTFPMLKSSFQWDAAQQSSSSICLCTSYMGGRFPKIIFSSVLFSNWPSETLKSSNGVLNICPPKYNLSTFTITAHESPSDVILTHYISTNKLSTVILCCLTGAQITLKIKAPRSFEILIQHYSVTSYNTTIWTITTVLT